jgi:RNA polymerase sigma factor (sigma-70 family)
MRWEELMTSVRINEVIRRLGGQLVRDERATIADSALLERFLAGRDEDAFAELVRRHGAMVYGVCRRLLHNRHDAEDAFQATFLVLVRRVSAARQMRSIGSWLYGVARRTALEARRAAARRRAREARAMSGVASKAPEETSDLHDTLDAEIDRLPEKLRAPLVLCDLGGKTRKEAARHLGWPEGTVASRLANARTTLAGRLKRRGVSLSGGVLALEGVGETASVVPPGLASSTVRVAVGQTLSSSGVATLVKGVMMTMLVKKLKTSVAVLMALAALGVGGTAFRGAAGQARAADDAKPRSEMEALRHENELLRLNLNVVLEKVRALEAEKEMSRARIRPDGARGVGLGVGGGMAMGTMGAQPFDVILDGTPKGVIRVTTTGVGVVSSGSSVVSDDGAKSGAVAGAQSGTKATMTEPLSAMQRLDAAVRRLRTARNGLERQAAVQALERALAAVKTAPSNAGNKENDP